MWNSPAEFFEMGGYALYVWCSFGVCALLLILEPLAINNRRKAIAVSYTHLTLPTILRV